MAQFECSAHFIGFALSIVAVISTTLGLKLVEKPAEEEESGKLHFLEANILSFRQ